MVKKNWNDEWMSSQNFFDVQTNNKTTRLIDGKRVHEYEEEEMVHNPGWDLIHSSEPIRPNQPMIRQGAWFHIWPVFQNNDRSKTLFLQWLVFSLCSDVLAGKLKGHFGLEFDMLRSKIGILFWFWHYS